MKLYEVVEEIIEKSPHTLSDASVVRKVNALRNQLIQSNSTDITTSTLDLEIGLSEYPLPCPQQNIKEVVVNGCTYERSELGATSPCEYYYILSGTIGIYPTPQIDVVEGIQIFITNEWGELSVGDMEAEVGLKNYDMLLVWGVLKDIDPGNEKFEKPYDRLYPSYWASTLSIDRSVIRGRW